MKTTHRLFKQQKNQGSPQAHLHFLKEQRQTPSAPLFETQKNQRFSPDTFAKNGLEIYMTRPASMAQVLILEENIHYSLIEHGADIKAVF